MLRRRWDDVRRNLRLEPRAAEPMAAAVVLDIDRIAREQLIRDRLGVDGHADTTALVLHAEAQSRDAARQTRRKPQSSLDRTHATEPADERRPGTRQRREVEAVAAV